MTETDAMPSMKRTSVSPTGRKFSEKSTSTIENKKHQLLLELAWWDFSQNMRNSNLVFPLRETVKV